MKITKISIEKFRGFQNVEFKLGSHLTVIAGQNGTQKTTLLGLLTQPFSITDKDNPMKDEVPLCGGSFRSGFSDKFRLSKSFDKIGEHKWTLFFDDETDYTAGSIDRGGKKKGEIRIWKVYKKTGKPDKRQGTGYIQLPVIFLSLKRLLPIGEDRDIMEDDKLSLTTDEFDFYQKWHNKILILTRDEDKITSSTSLLSKDKQTLGANTNYYDWQGNSAGQDNIGKILLAILSFKRLKEKYPSDYKGGILAIDEIDTAFYTGAQIRLLEALNSFASKYDIQIIFTTHSLTLLEEASKYKNNPHRKDQIKLLYFKKEGNKVIIKDNIDYAFIKNHLNRTVGQSAVKKIDVYTEDAEGAIFAKSLLGTSRTKSLNFQDKIKLGCGNLIQLASSKVPSFIYPNSIIMLDGDVNNEKKQLNRVHKIKNILVLPDNKSPEQIIAKFLFSLPSSDPLWSSINATYEHENCFMEYSNDEIQRDRDTAKKWFNLQLGLWGRNASKVINPWKKQNAELVNNFCSEFDDLFNEL